MEQNIPQREGFVYIQKAVSTDIPKRVQNNNALGIWNLFHVFHYLSKFSHSIPYKKLV